MLVLVIICIWPLARVRKLAAPLPLSKQHLEAQGTFDPLRKRAHDPHTGS